MSVQPNTTGIVCEGGLALSGDPRSVESLYIKHEHLLATSNHWEQLSKCSEQLLSKQMVNKYIADATGRNGLLAVRQGKRPHKHRKMLYVALRTLQNARELCEGHTLCVQREAGSANYVFQMLRIFAVLISEVCRNRS